MWWNIQLCTIWYYSLHHINLDVLTYLHFGEPLENVGAHKNIVVYIYPEEETGGF